MGRGRDDEQVSKLSSARTQAPKQSTGLFFVRCGAPSGSIPRTGYTKKHSSISWSVSGDTRGNLPGALLFTHHISQAIESVAATDSVFVFMGVTERLRQSLVLPMKR